MKEQDIFIEALQREVGPSRAAFLDEACQGDASLRQSIEELLADQGSEASCFLDRPINLAAYPQFSDLVGTQIGPYKLRERLGEGGMGVVYVAEQSAPVRRKVALKIIKPGLASRDVVARFEVERQSLAMMDHPNIARVFDGGATAAGYPYFVMELVQGPPITDYCDNTQRTTQQRLQLFLRVCRAVQHAHQKGIIHRDLKPSNILVPEIDGTAVPKVIDFGVAKAIDQKLTEQTVYTRFTQLVGTPLYMSPEQAGLGVVDIDTRSDVYSLGVLLYELLTGRTPFDREIMRRVGEDEMRRIIREDLPQRPSVTVSTLEAGVLSTIATCRRSDPGRLASVLRGELDWLVMKAMDKDRNRRYESANALAEDVARYLANKPIEARPPSTLYRIRKFARRNRTLVTSLVAVFVALGLGAFIATIGFLNATKQRDIARKANNTAQQRLDAMIKAQHATEKAISLLCEVFIRDWGREVDFERATVRSAMEKVATGLHATLQDAPEVEIRMRQTIASSYRRTSDHAKAREHLNKALDLARQIYHGREQQEVIADLYVELADELQWDEEEPADRSMLGEYAQKALDLHASLGIQNGRTGHAWFCKALSLTAPSEQEEARICLEKALKIAEGMPETEGMRQRVFCHLDLGTHLSHRCAVDFAKAHNHYEQALKIVSELPEDVRTLKATVIANQGECYRLQGDEHGALHRFREAWDIYRSPELNQETRGHRYALNLAELYVIAGEQDKADQLVEEIEAICRLDSPHESLVDLHMFKAWSHWLREDYEGETRELRDALTVVERFYPPQHPMVAYTNFHLAEALRHLGGEHMEEARAYYRNVLPITGLYVERRQMEVMAYHAHAVSLLYGESHTPDEQLKQAIDVAQSARDHVADWPRQYPWLEPHFCLAMGLAQHRLGDRSGAIESLSKGLEKCETFPSLHTTRPRVGSLPSAARRELEMTLADYYADDPEKNCMIDAMAVYKKGIEARMTDFREDHLQVALAQLRFGEFLLRRGEFELAELPLQNADTILKNNPDAVEANRQRAATALVKLQIGLSQLADQGQLPSSANAEELPRDKNEAR